MTIAEIRDNLNERLDYFATQYGETDTLTPAINTMITDDLAGILETVNPNNNYPPTAKA